MTTTFPDIILITSDEPWCEVWHTQLHYTYQLSKSHKVVFVGPPDPWNPIKLLFDRSDVRKLSQSLTILSYRNYFPVRFGKTAMRINDWLNEIRIKGIVGKNSINRSLLMWRFDHFRGYFLFSNRKYCRNLFHVIDPITNARYNDLFSINADLVVITSPKFFDYYRRLNANTILIPQGIDLESYSAAVPDMLVHGVASDSIVLLGTLTDAVDYSMLSRIAERFPGRLVVIGPDKIINSDQRAGWEKLRGSGNIHWLGAMKPSEFIPYIKVCRLGLICYSSTGIADNNLRSPLKVISYLAAGKAVVSNIDCEVPELENVAIHIVKNPDLMLDKVTEAMNNSIRFDEFAVDTYLRKIEYKNLIDQIFEHLSIGEN